MIKNIHARGRYMQIMGGSASTYVNANPGAQGVGNLRFNTSNQQMEVYDGSSWQELNMPHATVGLSDEAESLLDWARQKRDEELRIKSLAVKHPAVADALAAVAKAEEQVRIVAALVDTE